MPGTSVAVASAAAAIERTMARSFNAQTLTRQGNASLKRNVRRRGLQLDAPLLVEDRSWWPQIALRLDLDPVERVRRLTPPRAPDIAAALSELAGAGVPGLVIGDEHSAGHDVLAAARLPSAHLSEAIPHSVDPPTYLDRRRTECERPAVQRSGDIVIDEAPAGTAGEADLARNPAAFQTPAGALDAAGVIDLLRIADA
jgi:hypothetical protein